MKQLKNLITVILLTAGIAAGQETIYIRYLHSRFPDKSAHNGVMVIFMITTRDTADFPPTVTLPPECTAFENGFEKKILLNPHNLSVSFDGEKVAEKNPEVYQLIKDSVDLNNFRSSMLITYRIRNIPYTFSKMSMTPSFKEKRNQDKRVERRFEFLVSE